MSSPHRNCWSGPRCADCRTKEAARKRRARRLTAYGRPHTDLIDAAPVVAHVQRLLAQHITRGQITKASGLDHRIVERIASGRARRVRQATADAILAVTGPVQGYVPSAGSHRRIQALMLSGWTANQLVAAMNSPFLDLYDVLSRDKVRLQTAVKITALDDLLWNVAPPQYTRAQRTRVARMKVYAAERGWHPRLVWDDDEIDDPAARPHLGRLGTRVLPEPEDLLRLRADRVSRRDIARLYQVTEQAVRRAEIRARARLRVAEEASAA